MKELFFSGEGYRPLVLTENWQLAQLNYIPEQAPDKLTMLDQHDFTDETFTLLQGRSILITVEEGEYVLTPLRQYVTCNVPAMVWHNIAMEEGSIILITEGRDAHLKGCNRIPMPQELRDRVCALAEKLWTK